MPAFPQARVLALCETGSHVLWRWQIKPYARGEVTMAHGLLRYLRQDAAALGPNSSATGRSRSGPRPICWPGSSRTWIFDPIGHSGRRHLPGQGLRLGRGTGDADREGIMVRIIEYTFDDPRSTRLGNSTGW